MISKRLRIARYPPFLSLSLPSRQAGLFVEGGGGLCVYVMYSLGRGEAMFEIYIVMYQAKKK